MAERIIDLGEELAATRLTPFHLRLAALLGVILFVDGYDLFNAAYAAPYVKAEWGLAPAQIGFMLSIGLVGLALGALLQGPLADQFGRRRVLLAAVWALGGASLALALCTPSFVVFCGLRAILGLSLGMISPLAFVYINEWAPSSCANRFATLAFVLPFSLGGIAAGLAGLTIAPDYGWRALYLTGASALPIAAAAHFLLPESVRHLAAQGRRDELARLLARIRPERAAAYIGAERFVAGEGEVSKRRWSALLGPKYRGVTLAVWAAGALSLFCLHGLTGWLPSIVLEQGAGVRAAFGYGTLLMVMQIVGGSAGGWFADRYGRAATMVAGFLGGAVSLLLLAPALAGGWAVAVVAACGFFIFGTQAVMNNFQAMSYETNLRSTAVGAAVGVNRLGGIMGPLLIGLAHETGYGLWATLAMLAAAQVLAALIIFSRRPRAVRGTAAPAAGS